MSLQYGILGLLSYAPMNGYTLKKLFNKSINFIWTASLSQIYRELGALEGKGYVLSSIQQQDDRPDKKIYTITAQGQAAFLEWLRAFPDMLAAPKRDEFMLRVFFGSKLGKEELIAQFRKFIGERRQADAALTYSLEDIEESTAALRKSLSIAPPGARDDLLWRMINKRAVSTNRLLIAWAEDCVAELESTDAFD